MKKALVFLAVMPLALFALSCTKDLEGPDAPVNYEKVSFLASFDDPATRTDINTASGKVFWTTGDIIRYYSKNNGDVSQLSIGEILNSGTAQIDLNLTQDTPFAVAVYGGTGIEDKEKDACTIVDGLSGDQTGKFEDAHVAVVKVKKTNNQWPEQIRFSNIIPFVSFELEGTADGAEYAIFKSGNNERLHADGRMYVSFDDSGAVSDVSLPAQGGGSSIQIPVSGAGVYFIALAPGTYHGFNLSFYKKNVSGVDEYLGTVASEKTLDLSNRKALVKLGAVDARIERISTDLSANGEANSYIVSEPGDYKIPVSQANAKKCEVVWESTMTTDAPDAGKVVYNVDFKDGFIHFASGVDGNAVIAVKDDEDTILWSWHIWVSKGYDIEAKAYQTASGKVMDRALGALADDVPGLLYQWGRKDPFLPDGLASTPAFMAPITSTEKNGTITKSIRYPSTLINGDSVTEGDWLYAGRDNSLWYNVKSEYDPCPAGWQLPAAFGDDATSWVSGNYWSYVTSGAKALAWNGTAAEGLNRASLAMVRCIAGTKVDVTAVTLDKSAIALDPGQQVQLTASISPANASVQTVKWTTSDSDIATVVDGLVTGVGIGECTITAEADGKSAVCNVVCGTPVSSVTVTPAGIVVAPGASRQLNATIAPAEATVKTLDWTSSDPEVATVDENGVVTGVAEGTCVIKATAHNGEFGSCEVEVADHKVYDLSKGGTANCYIVNAPGDYSFYANVRGSSSIPLGDLSNATAIELWSTINSAASPMPGALIKNVDLANSVVYFTVPDPMVSGNAVIAVRDADSNIMWSWHIWLVEGYDPDATAQTYFNNAGIMMDRNLGALSAEVNDPRAVGFLYQWGRKDPFPAAQSFSGKTAVPYATSVSWPAAISAGSIETSVRNPMRFMKATATKQDWYDYTSSNDAMIEGRWSRDKTEYDPCPAGWRVPDGGASGVWSTAFGRSDGFSAQNYWLGGRYGYNFNGLLGDNGETMIWYPATAYINSGLGNISGHGQYAMYWSCTTYGWNADYNRLDERAHQFYFYTNTSIQPAQSYVRAQGCAVRCLKIGSFYGVPLQNLSIGKEGTTSTSITIKVGETRKLPLIFNPENASNKTIRVTSIDPSFVTIDTDGNVKGIKATYGPVQVTVTAADGDRTVTCNVSVEAQ
ncbi:MAG: Ig-like domain-containing protein [Bacteroidales bacterium]|nr:Ig-like domain-containing protein [Bacteroidales bacterium]